MRLEKLTYPNGRKLHYDYKTGYQVLEERLDGDEDNPLAQYVWHPYYIDAPVVRYYDANTDGDMDDENEGDQYYTHDANFNVTALLDDGGTALERYDYDPYGRVTRYNGSWGTPSTDYHNPVLYTGGWLDTETGLYFYRARYYHAQLGRFVGRDLAGYTDGMNLYEYVTGRPLDHLDPSGNLVEHEILDPPIELAPVCLFHIAKYEGLHFRNPRIIGDVRLCPPAGWRAGFWTRVRVELVGIVESAEGIDENFKNVEWTWLDPDCPEDMFCYFDEDDCVVQKDIVPFQGTVIQAFYWLGPMVPLNLYRVSVVQQPDYSGPCLIAYDYDGLYTHRTCLGCCRKSQ